MLFSIVRIGPSGPSLVFKSYIIYQLHIFYCYMLVYRKNFHLSIMCWSTNKPLMKKSVISRICHCIQRKCCRGVPLNTSHLYFEKLLFPFTSIFSLFLRFWGLFVNVRGSNAILIPCTSLQPEPALCDTCCCSRETFTRGNSPPVPPLAGAEKEDRMEEK